jgi:hypothetical protein
MNLTEKSQLRAVPTTHNADEPLALIDCGELSLLISSKDIVTLMSAQKIIASTLVQACGAIEFEQQQIPVFALNKALQLSANLSANQLTLVVVQHQTRLFALGCCALEKIERPDLQLFSVPVSMSSRKQPFTQFAVLNNRAAGLTSAANLSRLLELRGVDFSTAFASAGKRIQEAS